MSVVAAITATFVEQPAERSLLSHVQYLRELLDKHILKSLYWMDTCDVSADGLTEGAVPRDVLHQLMSGLMVLNHEHTGWSPKNSTSQCGSRAAETLGNNPNVVISHGGSRWKK